MSIAEFDTVADTYDSTRRPATKAEIDALSNELEGCNMVLDVGVGTGRFAEPLSDLGFEIVGVDISRGMMSKAKRKGVQNLIMADAHKLPFRERAFDASILMHVLHLITDWAYVMREVARVTRNRVITLLRQRGSSGVTLGEQAGVSPASPFASLWTLYSKLREEIGYPVKNWSRTRVWQNEEDLKQKIPPTKLVKVSDELLVMTLEEILERFEERRKRRFSSSQAMSDVPEDVHRQVISRMMSELQGTKTTTFERRVVEQLAVWKPEQLMDE